MTPNPTIGVWHEPASNQVTWDFIKQRGYPRYFRTFIGPAIQAANAAGWAVDDVIERFPLTPMPRVSANLRDFATSPMYNGWRLMVNNAMLVHGVKYVPYLRYPSDITTEPKLWDAVRTRLGKLSAVFELSGDAFSLGCYAGLMGLKQLKAIEPQREIGLPMLHEVPTFTLHKMLVDEAAWPPARAPWRQGDYIVHPDAPFDPTLVRFLAGLGFKSLVFAHRLISQEAL